MWIFSTVCNCMIIIVEWRFQNFQQFCKDFMDQCGVFDSTPCSSFLCKYQFWLESKDCIVTLVTREFHETSYSMNDLQTSEPVYKNLLFPSIQDGREVEWRSFKLVFQASFLLKLLYHNGCNKKAWLQQCWFLKQISLICPMSYGGFTSLRSS